MFRHLIASTAVSAALCTGIMPLRAYGREPAASVSISPGCSAIFAGKRADFGCVVAGQRSFQGRVCWSLEIDGAVLRRGETAADFNAGAVNRIAIPLELPAAKPGVILPAVLSVSIVAAGQSRAAATRQKRLWIFPSNPFHDRSAWLRRLDVRLFDPQGDTQRAFQKAGIPFTRADNLDALAKLDGGLLMIGQGVSLDEYPGLAEVIVAAAARGEAVLCLAPSEGYFPLPGSENHQGFRPDGIFIRGADVIRELDKRLDATDWPEDGRAAAVGFKICCCRGQAAALVDSSDENWPWLEIRFPTGRGRLLICGFDIVGKWENGPTPRYLLARLLEYLDKNESTSSKKEETHGT